MSNSLYINSRLEVCSIGTEEENVLLASDTDEEKGKNNSNNYNEIEDGEIVDSDSKEQNDDSNLCRFVPVSDNDIEIVSHFSPKGTDFNHDASFVINHLNRTNPIEQFSDNFSIYAQSWQSKSSHSRRSKNSARDNVFRSIKSNPYDNIHRSNHRSHHSNHSKHSGTRSCLNQLTVSSSRSTSSISQLLKNFNKVTLSKMNNQTNNTSTILSKPVLKLPENLVPVTNDDNEISIIGEFWKKTTYESKEFRINRETFQDVIKEGEKKVENACTKLNNLHISDDPNKHLNNIFAKPKPNLCENLLREVDVVNNGKITQTNFKKVTQWLDSCVKNSNDHINSIRNNPIIEANSDDENESKYDFVTDEINRMNNICYEKINSLRSSRNMFRNRVFRSSRRNSFFKDPWSRITTPIRSGKVRIVFGGVFTLLDKHRIYDLCLDSSRYVEDYEIDIKKGEAVVICRSTDSAIKFISQRPLECIRKFKIISVGEVSNCDLNATA